MSIEKITSFLQAVDQHTALQARLREILTRVPSESGSNIAEKVAALSVEAGTPFTPEEFLASHTPENTEELSEVELQSVAGGGSDLHLVTIGGPICNWS